MSTLRFKVKHQYGTDRFYPLNNSSEIMVKLMKQLCVTNEQLKILKTLGFKIEIEKPIEGTTVEEFKDE